MLGVVRSDGQKETAGPSTTLCFGRDDNSVGPLTAVRLTVSGAIFVRQNCHPDRSAAQSRDLRCAPVPAQRSSLCPTVWSHPFWGKGSGVHTIDITRTLSPFSMWRWPRRSLPLPSKTKSAEEGKLTHGLGRRYLAHGGRVKLRVYSAILHCVEYVGRSTAKFEAVAFSDQESLGERCAHIKKARPRDRVARCRSIELAGCELGREGFGVKPMGKVASALRERHAKVAVGTHRAMCTRCTSTADAAT